MKILPLVIVMATLSMSLAYASFNPNILKPKTPTPPVSTTQTTPTQMVDINHADAAELMTLKGIGEKKAAAIIAYRQQHGIFKSVNDLAEVQGFGEKKLASLLKNNDNRITAKTTA